MAVEVEEAVWRAPGESGVPKHTLIPRRTALVPSIAIAFHLVLGREGLDVGDTPQPGPDGRESTFDLGGGDVLEHVGADDEIETSAQAEPRQVAQVAAPDVPRGPVPLECVVARVDAGVFDVAAHAPQHRKPRAFAAPDVEDAPQASTEHVFRHGDGEPHLARETVACRDTIDWIAVPAVEVPAVVTL